MIYNQNSLDRESMHYYAIFQVKYMLSAIDGYAFTMEAYIANIG